MKKVFFLGKGYGSTVSFSIRWFFRGCQNCRIFTKKMQKKFKNFRGYGSTVEKGLKMR